MAWFALAYFLCAEAGLHLSKHHESYVTFWVPAGLYVSVLLLNPTRDWLWLSLGAFAGNFAFDFLFGTKFLVICGFFLANMAQAWVGAWLVRRFIAEKPSLATLRETVGLMLLCGGLSTVLGAAIGAGNMVILGLSPSFVATWKILWGSTSLAILLFTPFILAWFTKPDVRVEYLATRGARKTRIGCPSSAYRGI